DLGRGRVAARLGQGGMAGPHTRVRGHVGQRDQRPDAQRPVGLGLHLVEPGHGLEVHHAPRLDDVLLQVVEQVDAAGLEHAAGRLGQQLAGLGDGVGAGQLEAVHVLLRRPARTLSGVMGSSRTRTPVALNTALATAASVGTRQGSPRPAAEVLFPALAISVRIGTASNMSRAPSTLYDSMLGFTCVPTLRSMTRFSNSAHDTPWIMAPMTWLSAVRALMGKPQSFTATTFTTRTLPVSASTSTSTNCVPARSLR